MKSSHENLGYNNEQQSNSNQGFDIVKDGVIPFSVAFTAGDLLASLSDQLYKSTEHVTPHDPKTLLVLGFAAFCTFAFNNQD